ncbi:MAG TPA: tetratricopeptide repeat protein [Candidatus Dormibacteraeota bacterium]|nr:tetratricopeptide repeat protein [Candidatus Dormibacteraeota bacterium]
MEAESAAALHRRAQHLAAVGRNDEAIPLLSRAVALEPQSSELKCDLAVALMKTRRLVDADRVAYEAIATSPEDERAYRVRSVVLRNMRRPRDALALARESVRLAPENAWGWHAVAQACIELKNHSEAWVAAQKVLELAPERGDSHQLAGRVAIALRKWSVAESASREALRLDPNDWSAMNNLGVALLRQGRRAEATQAYDRAAQMNPAAEIPRQNIVRASRTHHGPRLVLDLLLILLMPVMAPVILVRWLVQWLRAREARSGLSRGGRRYYRSQTIPGVVSTLSPRDFGIVCGVASVIVWWILAVPAIVVLNALAPRWSSFDVLFPFAMTIPLAVATGFLFGWLRARVSRVEGGPR